MTGSNRSTHPQKGKAGGEEGLDFQDVMRLISDNISDTVWLMDLDLRPKFISSSVTRLRGYTLEELQNLPLDQQLPPESLARALQAAAEALTPEKLADKDARIEYKAELEFYKKDGSTFWSENTFTILRDNAGVPTSILGVGRDITERKKAEADLAASELRFRTLVENQSEGVGISDLEERFVFANPAAHAIFGVPPGGLVGKSLKQYVVPSQWRYIEEQTRQRKKGKESTYEIDIQRPDGEVRTLLVSAKPLRDVDGNCSQILAVFLDITSRKQTEDVLKASEERYRTFIDSTPDLVFLKDEQLRNITLNKAFVDFIGKPEAELLGKTDAEFMQPDAAAKCRETDLETLRQGVVVTSQESVGEKIFETIKFPVPLQGGKVGVGGYVRDITERMHAENALAEERSLLMSLMDTIPDAIYFKDIHSRFTRANQATANHLGVENPEALKGKTDFDFYSEEHARPAYEDEQTIIRNGTPLVGLEEKEVFLDGREVWVSTTKMPLLNKDGEIVGTFGISRDITPSKMAADELARSRNMLQLVLSHIPQRVFWMDRNLTYMGCNPAFAMDRGNRTPEEIIGLKDDDLFPPELSVINRVEDMHILETLEPIINREAKVQDKVGNPTWVRLSLVPLQDVDEKVIGLLGIYEDISKRRMAEEQLARSRQMLQLVLDTIPQRVFWKDRNSVFMGCNKAFAIEAGRTHPDDITGLTDDDLPWPENVERYRADDRRVMENDTPIFNFMEKLRDLDGSLRWVNSSKAPLHDQNGDVIGVLGVYEDITERKRMEDQLRTSLEEKEVLLREVHHRVKNNMQVISSLLSLEREEISDPAAREVFLTSQERIRAMVMVHEWLYRSSDLAHINLAEYAGELSEQLYAMYGEGIGDINIEVEAAGVLVDIDDAIPCGLILNEIITNSLKHAFPGKCGGKIWVNASADETGAVTLRVGDDGVGMPPGVTPQTSPTLGLQLVTDLTRQMKGTLEVPRGKGTEYIIRFGGKGGE